MNTSILASYFTAEALGESFPEFVEKVHSWEVCSLEQVGEMLRKSFYWFLRDPCFACLLTSKRISLLSKEAHLEKRRKMLRLMRRREELD